MTTAGWTILAVLVTARVVYAMVRTAKGRW